MPPSLLSTFATSTQATCPRCNYALAGLAADQCPECGTRLALGIIADPAQPEAIPARLLLLWLLIFNLLPPAELLLTMHAVAYAPMTAAYRKQTPSYASLLWSTLTQQGPFDTLSYLWPPLISIAAATWLFRLRNARKSHRKLKGTRAFCLSLLTAMLVLSVVTIMGSWLS